MTPIRRACRRSELFSRGSAPPIERSSSLLDSEIHQAEGLWVIGDSLALRVCELRAISQVTVAYWVFVVAGESCQWARFEEGCMSIHPIELTDSYPEWRMLSLFWLKRSCVLPLENTTVRLSIVHGSVSEVPEAISSASLWRLRARRICSPSSV